jgi:PKHD-type hydroxylase
MNNNIKIIENFLSIEECNDILSKYSNELKLKIAETVNNNSKIRKSSVGWIEDLGVINERLKIILKSNFNFNRAEVTGLGPFQFTEYKFGQFYDWHIDANNDVYKDRFISIVIQLNDTYDGGILEIKNIKGELIPIENKIGTLYIFNSRLLHRVTPVVDGVRYSLVNWISLVKTNLGKQNLI